MACRQKRPDRHSRAGGSEGAARMTRLRWGVLTATLVAIVSVTWILPLSGELLGGMALTLLAAFIVTL